MLISGGNVQSFLLLGVVAQLLTTSVSKKKDHSTSTYVYSAVILFFETEVVLEVVQACVECCQRRNPRSTTHYLVNYI